MQDLTSLSNKTKLEKNSVFIELLRSIPISDHNFLLIMATFIGIGAGLASVLFRFVLSQMHHFFLGTVYHWLTSYSIYLLPLIPVTGALLLIPFAWKYQGEINGYGMPRFLISVHLKGGLIKTRNIFLKIITSAITISTGGSAGVEGPIAQIGGAVGSTVGRLFSMSSKRLQVLIACGSAGGIAAQFNAPLAGVLFAQEIVMIGEFQLQSFGVIVISSGIATAISRAFFSSAPTFGLLTYNITNPLEFILYLIMGVLIGVLAFLFIRVFFGIGDYFKNLKINDYLKPIIGAFLVGCLGLLHFGALSDGYEYIIQAISSPSPLTISVLLLLVVLKIVGTSITLGSGNVGGVFAPCLFIGSMFGAVFGWCMSYLFPAANISPGSYALVGMGAFLAAATHAPMTAIFLLFELTNDYHVIIPIMFTSVIGVMVAQHFCEDSLDSMELSRMNIKLNAGKEVNIMRSITVGEVMDKEFEWIHESMTLSAFLKQLPETGTQYFPVLNQDKLLSGIVSFQDIRNVINEEGLGDLIVMKELAENNLITLNRNNTLDQAMQSFGLKDIDQIPVVDLENPKKLLGMLKRKKVLMAYNKAVLIKEQEKKF